MYRLPAFLVVSAAAGWAVVLGCAAAAQAAPAAVTGTSCTSYPYADTNGIDPNGFFAPNETSYVAACLDQSGYNLAHVEKGPSATVTLGNPGTWSGSARQAGFPVRGAAADGDVVEVSSGQGVSTGPTGGPPGPTLQGPFLGVVVAVDNLGEPTVRLYDITAHLVETYHFRPSPTTSPSYINFSGGIGEDRPAVAGTSTPSPTYSSTPAAPPTSVAVSTTPTLTPSPTPTPPTPSPTPTFTAPPTATSTPTPAPVHHSAKGPLRLIGLGSLSSRSVLEIVAGLIVFLVAALATRVGLTRRR